MPSASEAKQIRVLGPIELGRADDPPLSPRLRRLLAGLVIGLPDGLFSAPSTGTGTVMRRPVLERYAQAAGYAQVEVLPIEDFGFFRFTGCADPPGRVRSRVRAASGRRPAGPPRTG